LKTKVVVSRMISSWGTDSHSGDHFRVRIVGVIGQSVASTHFQIDSVPRVDGLEHADHVVVRETQHARCVHVHKNIT